jgi:hypothetical protein
MPVKYPYKPSAHTQSITHNDQQAAILTMCDPKNTKQFEMYEACGHRLPAEACDSFSYEHYKCYAAPDMAKNVPAYDWKEGERFTCMCRFCEESKNINGQWKYGKKWINRVYFK